MFIHYTMVLPYILYQLAFIFKSLTERWETCEQVLISLQKGVNKFITSHKVSHLCNQHNYQCTFQLSCQSCTRKQIHLASVFVTTAALLRKRVIVNKQMQIGTCKIQTSGCKSAPAQYIILCLYYLALPRDLSRKQIKTELMLC